MNKQELLQNHYASKKAYSYRDEETMLVDLLLKENRELKRKLKIKEETDK